MVASRSPAAISREVPDRAVLVTYIRIRSRTLLKCDLYDLELKVKYSDLLLKLHV